MSEHIYRTLVHDTNDVIGAVAYSLYKQHKLEWVLQYKSQQARRKAQLARMACG